MAGVPSLPLPDDPLDADAFVRDAIRKQFGRPMESTSGIPGSFYTINREADLRQICREILSERNGNQRIS